MEFLRFGSSIPGSYWGCCDMCIIQNFKYSPSAKASIEIVSGDGGNPCLIGGSSAFAGPTYRDIFEQRIKIGTFNQRVMPNHGFLAVLTESQISGGYGKEWLAILKENGFEFIRTVDNSVYTGEVLLPASGQFTGSSHKNYLFGLFRNIGNGAVKDPFTPPAQWTELPDPYGGDMSPLNMQKVQLDFWKSHPMKPLMTEAQVKAAGAPVVKAGKRSLFPQQPAEQRLASEKAEADKWTTKLKEVSSVKSKTAEAFPVG